MAHIDVLSDTGNAQLTQILGGVYGRYKVETGKFAIAPEFRPVSPPLFSYIPADGVPVGPGAVTPLQVPDGREALMRANLMLNLAQRWGQLYKQVAPRARDMAAMMVQADKSMVADGVRNHMIAAGWRAFMVPVRAQFQSGCVTEAADERELLANLQSARQIGVATVCTDEAPLKCGSDVYSTGLIQQADTQQARQIDNDGADTPTQQATQTGPDSPAPWAAWESGSGANAQVAGAMLVVAQTPAGAIEAANWLLEQQQRFPELVRTEVAISRVLDMQQIAPERDDYYERDRY